MDGNSTKQEAAGEVTLWTVAEDLRLVDGQAADLEAALEHDATAEHAGKIAELKQCYEDVRAIVGALRKEAEPNVRNARPSIREEARQAIELAGELNGRCTAGLAKLAALAARGQEGQESHGK